MVLVAHDFLKEFIVTEGLLELFEGRQMNVDGRAFDSKGALESISGLPRALVGILFDLIPGPVVY